MTLAPPLTVFTDVEECPGCRTMLAIVTDGHRARVHADNGASTDAVSTLPDGRLEAACPVPVPGSESPCHGYVTFDPSTPGGWRAATSLDVLDLDSADPIGR